MEQRSHPSTASAPAATDRRRHPRIGDGPPLLVRNLDAYVHDISRSGICLVPATPMAPGERPVLQLEDALDHSTQEIEGEVLWSLAGRAGLRWITLSEAVDRWLARRFELWLAPQPGAISQ
jgi:hypothetical protein